MTLGSSQRSLELAMYIARWYLADEPPPSTLCRLTECELPLSVGTAAE
jgi:hypothetical protein